MPIPHDTPNSQKFKRAIGDWDRAETPSELQSAESGLLKALVISINSTQVLAEVRRAERERVAQMVRDCMFKIGQQITE